MPRFYLGSAPTKNPGFSFIVLCAAEYQPRAALLAPASVLRIPLEDVEEPISHQTARQIEATARKAARAWRQGHRLLVSCVAGRNRSALVSALTISRITEDPPEIIAEHIRKTRIDPYGSAALTNEVFWEFLTNYC